jgi:hypothetical protein
MARLFPWRHLLLGQGDLFGALAFAHQRSRNGLVLLRHGAKHRLSRVRSRPTVPRRSRRSNPWRCGADLYPRWLSPSRRQQPFRGDLDGVRTQLRGRTEPRCTKCWLSGSIGIGRGCRFGPRFERSDDQSSWFGPVASAEWLLSATRLAEAAASLARGRRRSASAAKGQGPVGQQHVPEEQRRSARS